MKKRKFDFVCIIGYSVNNIKNTIVMTFHRQQPQRLPPISITDYDKFGNIKTNTKLFVPLKIISQEILIWISYYLQFVNLQETLRWKHLRQT